MKAAIIVNLSKEKAISCAERIVALMREHGASVAMPIECKGHFRSSSITYYFSLRQLLAHSDAAITVGGDGTIIHAAKYAAQTDTPLIGVNVGRLGFAADVETEEIDSLARLITGDYSVENRLLLDIEVIKDGVSRHYLAVNDAVVAHGQLSKIIDLTLSLDGEVISKYRADGLLFSTPTGSTAYSLSAGGPILSPQMRCILMTPVCPHSLFSRSVVFEEDSQLTVTVKIPLDCSCVLTVDGEENIDIQENDSVIIRRSEQTLRLMSLKKRNFYKKLNEKLKEREIK
ncbi:MAG: NAD(+)/NADH kinase [Ruminococcus sp.]|jgi:NAD+ kinase|uniref:NAD(+)/NADH kinase n=1 Tax=unclassified Ruminococcus TaxID=2608920 RepID=UPI00164BE181|nr:NAD(+)/NADH kinase [uncultured Ruminococcus sp.]MBQ1586850.1 NAD(+)/NADH kinase [Ruminococcus sp.]MBQ2280628.1 NAD(+)/NADH kinase [Ruminococcus sp.]MBQ2441984.1 NAD(+)/NADH kinase [Ruminococcus sp.]MBQ4171636.1 NAD(+)/NADH kinase [Ruminococcus sp.]MBQ4213748.1 NAD(+)/NADH kinase [Ruminococcus sp.]